MQWPHAIVGAEPIIFNRDDMLRMLRANSLTTLVELIDVLEKRRKGRPKRRWMDSITQDFTEKGLSGEDVLKRAA